MPRALEPPRRTIKTKFPEVEGKSEASGKLMVMKNHLQETLPASVCPLAHRLYARLGRRERRFQIRPEPDMPHGFQEETLQGDQHKYQHKTGWNGGHGTFQNIPPDTTRGGTSLNNPCGLSQLPYISLSLSFFHDNRSTCPFQKIL